MSMKGVMSFVQRVIALALLIALGTWLFYVGREHQIFLDNRTIERDGKTFRAFEQVNVTVDGGAPVELLARDRDMVKTIGPAFKIRLEIFDFMGGDIERTIEREVRPEFKKDILLNIPLMAAEREDFILPPPGTAPASN